MLTTHNLPCLLVELLEHSPWSRREGGKALPYLPKTVTGCFQNILQDQWILGYLTQDRTRV